VADIPNRYEKKIYDDDDIKFGLVLCWYCGRFLTVPKELIRRNYVSFWTTTKKALIVRQILKHKLL